MIIIGIDPGKTGAVAFLWDSGAVDVFDMPAGPAGLSAALDIDDQHLSPSPRFVAYVEQQQAMPKQGVSSTFKIGQSYGEILGVCGALGIRVVTVTPVKWKMVMGLRGKDKEASRALAMRLFPQIAGELQRKKDHGRAEALLIAEWGRRQEREPDVKEV
jgi:hypothetical protein